MDQYSSRLLESAFEGMIRKGISSLFRASGSTSLSKTSLVKECEQSLYMVPDNVAFAESNRGIVK